MTKRFARLGLRQKFVGGTSLLLMCIAIFIFVFFPTRQERALSEYLNDKATGLAVALANSVSAGMLSDDAASVQSALDGFSNVGGLSFALALKADGSSLAGLREANSTDHAEQIRSSMKADALTVVSHSNNILAFTPVRSGRNRLGLVVLGVDRTKLSSDTSTAVLAALAVGSFILLLRFAAIFWLTNEVVVKPVVRGAGGLDNADLNLRFNSTSGDEIGRLTRSFDHFVGSIRQTLIEVSEASTAVASASAEISSSTEEMAAGAQE